VLLKRQLSEAQGADKERKKLQDKVDKLENRVSISTPSATVSVLPLDSYIRRCHYTKMEETIQQKVVQKEAELNATYDERLHNYEDRLADHACLFEIRPIVILFLYCFRERDLQRQLDLTKEQLRDLRASNETTQAKLFDHSERQGASFILASAALYYSSSDFSEDQETVRKLAEMDIVAADLERANSRVAEVERRNASISRSFNPNLLSLFCRIEQEKLRAEIETVRSGNENVEQCVYLSQFRVTLGDQLVIVFAVSGICNPKCPSYSSRRHVCCKA
jgi:homeobox protein cut-like